MKKKQTIKCDVSHCDFYSDKHLCTLDSIKVGNCDCGPKGDSENTLCESYRHEKDR